MPERLIEIRTRLIDARVKRSTLQKAAIDANSLAIEANAACEAVQDEFNAELKKWLEKEAKA